jgi:hypothetical protein
MIIFIRDFVETASPSVTRHLSANHNLTNGLIRPLLYFAHRAEASWRFSDLDSLVTPS